MEYNFEADLHTHPQKMCSILPYLSNTGLPQKDDQLPLF